MKMAVAYLSSKRDHAEVFAPYERASGATGAALDSFVKASCLFLLSRTLFQIRKGIREAFHDFGMNPNDDMFVTMAIPVSDMTDEKTEALYKDLLERAWIIATSTSRLADSASLKDMERLLADNPDRSSIYCNVYPEVSANVMAFRNSPLAGKDSRNIYLLSDTGAGTVDQCTFTCTESGADIATNYFSANVFPLGSGTIERRCQAKSGGTLEEWRQKKEQEVQDNTLKAICNSVRNELFGNTRARTLPQLQDHLPDGNGVESLQTIREKVFLIFSGGGDMFAPYRSAVLQAIKEYTSRAGHVDWSARIIEMPKPADLHIPSGCQKWMQRLFVAYGLSFLYDNLPTNRFPHETALNKRRSRRSSSGTMAAGTSETLRKCPFCGGQNPYCLHCDGKGVV